MTDTTKQALEAFVLQMIEAAKTGASWTAEQTPLLVQEWLKWQLGEAALLLVICYLGIAFALGWARYFHIRHLADIKENGYARHDWQDGRNLTLVGSATVFLITTGTFGWTILKVLVAPRVVVFEKFIEVIK